MKNKDKQSLNISCHGNSVKIKDYFK